MDSSPDLSASHQGVSGGVSQQSLPGRKTLLSGAQPRPCERPRFILFAMPPRQQDAPVPRTLKNCFSGFSPYKPGLSGLSPLSTSVRQKHHFRVFFGFPSEWTKAGFFDSTTPSALTQRNAIDETLSNWLKALLHMARTLFIHSSPITNATEKNQPITFRKSRRPPIAIGFGDLKRSQERPVACAMACHFSSKRCTK